MEVKMEATTDPLVACVSCGAALAEDQRYCLHCGSAQGDPRVAYRELIAPAVTAPAAAAPSPIVGGQLPVAAAAQAPAPPRDWTPVIALGGLATLALVLVVGVLIGKSGTPTAAAPQVITVAGGGAPTAAAPVAATSITEDWPADADGFTIELGSVPKDGTTSAQVDQAKADATAKGAGNVGVLDGDAHGAPESGNWVIYTGVYDTRAQARRALAQLKDDYPDAAVIAVGGSAAGAGGGGSGGGDANPVDTKAGAKAVQDLNSATGEDYQRKSSRLPDTVALPGKPPPRDNKAPGGGSGAETIG
jgi:hypothetical protein